MSDLPVHIWYDGIDVEECEFAGGKQYVRDDGIPTKGMIDWLVMAMEAYPGWNGCVELHPHADPVGREDIRLALYRAAGIAP